MRQHRELGSFLQNGQSMEGGIYNTGHVESRNFTWSQSQPSGPSKLPKHRNRGLEIIGFIHFLLTDEKEHDSPIGFNAFEQELSSPFVNYKGP